MADPISTPEPLELLGLGGLYNGERYTVPAGTSATAGRSSLATCPVTRCRNFARLEGRLLRDELVSALAPEHVRFLNVGDGRLFIENLAGRDVRVGGRAVADRVKVDLQEGPVEVMFGPGERLIAALPGTTGPLQNLRTSEENPALSGMVDPLTATLTMHGGPLRPEDIDPPLRLCPDPTPKRPATTPPGDAPAAASPGAKAKQPRRRRPRGGSRGAMFFSILLHLVVILGLFSYIASGLVPAPGGRVTEVTMEAPSSLPTVMPLRPQDETPVPSEAPPDENEMPSMAEDEVPAGFTNGPGIDDAPDQGLPGNAGGDPVGAVGLGPGELSGGGIPGRGANGTRPANSKRGESRPLWLALDWLRRHQDEDGSWGGISSLERCTTCTGEGRRQYRIALTGLATLAFTGAGHTHREGEFQQTVRSAAKFLVGRCGPDGSFHGERVSSEDRRMYGQAMAVLGISELYRQSRSPFLKRVIERGVRFIERAQTSYAGWRYQPDRRSSDTSVTGWQVLALFAAKRAGISVNPATRSGVRRWLSSMTENHTYRVGYNRRGRGSPAMTATGLIMNILLGRPSSDPVLRGGFRILAAHRPVWPPTPPPAGRAGGVNLYYWYFGTLATAKKRGSEWSPWRKTLRTALLANQEDRPDAMGSWPPVGQWEKIGGRVVSTSLGALCLELAEGMSTAFK